MTSNVEPIHPDHDAVTMARAVARSVASAVAGNDNDDRAEIYRKAGLGLIAALGELGIDAAIAKRFDHARDAAGSIRAAVAGMASDSVNPELVRFAAEAFDAARDIEAAIVEETWIGDGPSAGDVKAAEAALRNHLVFGQVGLVFASGRRRAAGSLADLDGLEGAVCVHLDDENYSAEVAEALLFAWAVSRIMDGAPISSTEIALWRNGRLPILQALAPERIGVLLADAERAATPTPPAAA